MLGRMNKLCVFTHGYALTRICGPLLPQGEADVLFYEGAYYFYFNNCTYPFHLRILFTHEVRPV